jgi:hypothetical protein
MKSVAARVGNVGGCLAGLALAAGVVGCGQDLSRPETMELARRGGVFVSYNGLGFNTMAKVAEETSDELGMVHVDGDNVQDEERLYRILGEANVVYLGFHSKGSTHADDLVEECKKRGIDVQIAYSLDAFTSNLFPDNVRKVSNIYSSVPYVFGKQTTRGGLKKEEKTLKKTWHHNLPRSAKAFMKKGIEQSRSEKLGYSFVPRQKSK